MFPSRSVESPRVPKGVEGKLLRRLNNPPDNKAVVSAKDILRQVWLGIDPEEGHRGDTAEASDNQIRDAIATIAWANIDNRYQKGERPGILPFGGRRTRKGKLLVDRIGIGLSGENSDDRITYSLVYPISKLGPFKFVRDKPLFLDVRSTGIRKTNGDSDKQTVFRFPLYSSEPPFLRVEGRGVTDPGEVSRAREWLCGVLDYWGAANMPRLRDIPTKSQRRRGISSADKH